MKFSAASWRATIAVDWNLTYIEGVPGPGDISGTLGKFPRLASEKGTSLLNTWWISSTGRSHTRLPDWSCNDGVS